MSSGGFNAAGLRQISADEAEKVKQDDERWFKRLCCDIERKLVAAAKQQRTQVTFGPTIIVDDHPDGGSPYSIRFDERAVDWLNGLGFTVTPLVRPGCYLISWAL
jgi:hypothetical protein